MFAFFHKIFSPKSNQTDAEDPETLFLKEFYCTGCRKHCPLDRIKCSGGLRDKKQRLMEFQHKPQ